MAPTRETGVLQEDRKYPPTLTSGDAPTSHKNKTEKYRLTPHLRERGQGWMEESFNMTPKRGKKKKIFFPV